MATNLIPVSEWVFNRYRITYSQNEMGPVLLTKYLVSTDTHLDSIVQDAWPSSSYNYYFAEVVEENVPSPPQIGIMYGHPVYASGWER